MTTANRTMRAGVALGTALALLVPLDPAGAQPAGPATPTEHVIVQLTGAPALKGVTGLASPNAVTRSSARTTVRRRDAALHTQHQQFRSQLQAAGVHATFGADLTGVLNAVAVTVAPGDLARLRAASGVAGVYPDTTMHAVADPDVSITGAPQVWRTDDPNGNPNTGTGETVAVIDTGIDYTHPDLGDGFGAGHKVVAGYDFVNGDSDPMDDNGHGTHVAGLVAGRAAASGGRTGEAPDASLTAYKVLDAAGNGPESRVIEGLDAAVATDNPNRADVVNLSLSGPAAPDDPLDQACEDAIASGVVVVAAAGNSGPGQSTVGSPADAPDVLAVGASFTGVDLPSVTVTAPVTHPIAVTRLGMSANPPAEGKNLDVVDVGAGTPAEFDAVDVKGKAALVAYNSFQVDAVTAAAEQHGAAALLFYKPNYYSQPGGQPGPVLPDVAPGTTDPDKLGLVATIMSGTDGTDILQWLSTGPVRIRLGSQDATDDLASFSAHGPALGSYALKPDLVAPGVEIASTWLGGGYRDESGTSMASPHVAGAAALIRQAHPTWSAGQVAAALTGGAHPLPGYGSDVVGAGRLDVSAADQESVLPSPRVLDLGLADLSQPRTSARGTVTLTNVTRRAVTLTFAAHRDTGSTLQTFYSPTSARLAAGASVRVTVSLTGTAPTTGSDQTGVLVAKGGGHSLAVPYALAVRPLDLHATPDPTSADSSVLIHSEAQLADVPTVVITPPTGRPTTVAATFDHTGWWRLAVPAGPVGTYRVTASAPSRLGAVVTGTTTFEKLAPTSGSGGWKSVGPDSAGAQQLAPTSRPGRMYAIPQASAHAGLFRTDDDGKTWHELRRVPVADGVNMGVAADPTDPDTVYLALQSGGLDPGYKGKILVSHDAGKTWTTLPFPDVAMRSLSIDTTGSMLVATGFTGNVYVSADRGATWTAEPIPGGIPTQAGIVGHDVYVAIGTQVYVIRNVDSTPSAPQLLFTAPGNTQSVLEVLGDSHVLLARTTTVLYASRDNGATWSALFTPPAGDQYLNSVQIVHGDIYVTGSKHIWVDRGEGETWDPIPTPVPADTFRIASSDPSGDQLVVSGQATGIFTTGDSGQSYTRVGLTGAPVTALAVDQTATGTTGLVAGTPLSVFGSSLPDARTPTAATRDWGITKQQTQIGFRVVSLAVDPSAPQTVYAVVGNAFSRVEIQRSTDGGTTWTGLEQVRSGSHGYQVIVDPANPNYLYVVLQDAISPGVMVSRDAGRTWRKNDLPALVTSVAGDPKDPNRIWLGGPSGLYRSTDGGQTMTRLSSTPVTTIAVDPTDAQHLLVGGNGIYESHDGGRTLSETAQSSYRLNISAIAFARDGSVYAADAASVDGAGLPVGARGVLGRPRGSATWTNVSDGLPDLDVTSLAVSPDGHWLFAGTDGGGVYRLAAR